MPLIQPILKHVDSFTVTGFKVRTQNRDEFNQETAKLPNLWQQFYSSNLATNTSVFGVYSGYEADANSPYTVTVGITGAEQSIELNNININSGNYLVFQGKGTMPLTVIETWQRVWNYFTEDSAYQRCFMTDFEAYSNGDEIAIYIGVN